MLETFKWVKLILGSGILILAGLVVGSLIYLLTGTKYLSIDVNPSIELEVNRINKIVSVNALNEDAKKVISGLKLKGEDLDDAVEDIMESMIKNGYITNETDNEILLTAKDGEESKEILNEANIVINTILEGKKLQAKLISQSIDFTEKDLEDAHKYNISVGKQNIIKRILQEDNTLTMEELASTRVSDLFAYSAQNKISFDDILDDYEDAVEDAMEANGDNNKNTLNTTVKNEVVNNQENNKVNKTVNNTQETIQKKIQYKKQKQEIYDDDDDDEICDDCGRLESICKDSCDDDDDDDDRDICDDCGRLESICKDSCDND